MVPLELEKGQDAQSLRDQRILRFGVDHVAFDRSDPSEFQVDRFSAGFDPRLRLAAKSLQLIKMDWKRGETTDDDEAET